MIDCKFVVICFALVQTLKADLDDEFLRKKTRVNDGHSLSLERVKWLFFTRASLFVTAEVDWKYVGEDLILDLIGKSVETSHLVSCNTCPSAEDMSNVSMGRDELLFHKRYTAEVRTRLT